MSGPRPTTVRGNDWRKVEVPPLEEFVPALPVTVVVPYYEAPEALALTLAALERQTYRRDLFEVVVVDDGSRIPLEQPKGTSLDVRVVHQEDRGFGLARARNTGASAASHDILVFLDCDMLPEEDWLAAHARWHHALSDALSLGFRAHVEVDGIDESAIRNRNGSLADLFSGRAVDRPEWIEFHMARTNELTSTADDLFRVVTGGNLGVARGFFELVGRFDETFTQWGAEDTEFGFRSYTRGGLLVPVREAFCWHQGAGAAPSTAESRSLELQRAKIAHLIAHYGFRQASPGRSFTVPQYIVTVETGDVPVEKISATIERVLGDRIYDLIILIEDRPGDVGFEWLRRQFEPDPRIQFVSAGTALEQFPTASFHVTLPAGARVAQDIIYRLRAELGGLVSGTALLGDGSRVLITRAWALHRARRSARSVTDFGEIVVMSARKLEPETASHTRLASRQVSRRARRFRSKIGRVLREARRIRSPRQAWCFLRWLLNAIRWRLRGARRYRRTRMPVDDVTPGASYPLGAEIAALGVRSRAVFGLSRRVAADLGGQHVDLVVADTPQGAAAEVPVVVLSESPSRLAVPALDPHTTNPIGWIRQAESKVAALGSLDLLPLGMEAHRVVATDDRTGLLLTHHLEDVAAYHADVTARAAVLARLAATGVLIHLADQDPKLEESLGSELYGLMTDPSTWGSDLGARELKSIRMRRLALREHSLRSRARQVIEFGGLEAPALPEVSILLVTKRPELLEEALAGVLAQTYPRLELVLVLHGDGFDGADAKVSGFEYPVIVNRVNGERSLGEALNVALNASGGTLVTKMDDDDVYDAEHIWDLVLAHEYSRAELVAKGAEYVYLARSDRTLHRFAGRGEAYSTSATIAGGAMMISRHDLDLAGGWRRVRRGVDRALIEDVMKIGGRVYRTHGAGYVLVRHGAGHTWESDDAYFLHQADQVRPGWAPEFAGLDPLATPPSAADGPVSA